MSSLSDKEWECVQGAFLKPIYDAKDVQDFIKELKKSIKDTEYELDPKNLMWEDVCEIIDELAGDKLISQKGEEVKK